VARATGYRVLRSATAGGRFVVIVDMNVTTGATTKAAGVTTIWSANHNYGPGGPRLATPDTSPWFEVIDVGNDPRWFKLVAYNAAGQGPASAVLYSVPSYPPQPSIPPQTVPPTTERPGYWPGPVPDLFVRPGVGSMEVAVKWLPAQWATGYRVFRADAPEGPFVVTADIDITTGAVTKADDVTTIWSANHVYQVGGAPLTTPDTSPWFEYIDLGPGTRWYFVAAYTPGGQGLPSAVASAGPP
jgi:hypothetical protein